MVINLTRAYATIGADAIGASCASVTIYCCWAGGYTFWTYWVCW